MITKCPACNAKYTGKSQCYRCGSDLESLVAVVDKSEELHKNAMKSFNNRDFEQMYRFAKRSNDLHHSPISMKFRACSALLSGHYHDALSIWIKLTQ